PLLRPRITLSRICLDSAWVHDPDFRDLVHYVWIRFFKRYGNRQRIYSLYVDDRFNKGRWTPVYCDGTVKGQLHGFSVDGSPVGERCAITKMKRPDSPCLIGLPRLGKCG